MIFAILSDIHANREAFDACLADIRQRNCDRIIILGDIVGYGADPEYCVDTVMALHEMGAIVVRGNHDAAIDNTETELGSVALEVINWTRQRLNGDQRSYLAGLPLTADAGSLFLVHAEPRAPAQWSYVTEIGQAGTSLRAVNRHLIACGHVHIPALYYIGIRGEVVRFRPRLNVPVRLGGSRQWLAVIGSVGQPRDGVPMAAYAEWDDRACTLTTRRVGYDIPQAVNKIRAAGLPERLAQRLLEAR